MNFDDVKSDSQLLLESINEKIIERNKEEEKGVRPHLGSSLIGRECKRELWYTFRWFAKSSFGGRMLRLFNRGHREEERFEQWVADISDKFWALDPRTGKQIRIVNVNGHFGGSLDGVVRNPGHLKGDYLTEFKTHNDKSYKKVVLDGVKKAKFEHYVQMQIYLYHKPNLKAALYFAINKNDDSLYIEVVERDPEVAEQNLEKAVEIISSDQEPERMKGASENFFYCKYFCSYTNKCFNESMEPEFKNCRNCSFSKPIDDGKWFCEHHDKELSLDDQMEGCDEYARIC